MANVRSSWLAAVCICVSTPATAQGTAPPLVVQPNEAILPVGAAQSFQILDAQGREVRSDDWSVSDATVAALTIEDGRAVLVGKSPGPVVLTGSGARTTEVVVPGQGAVIQDAQQAWILRPTDGRFTHLVWSTSAWGASSEAENFTETAPWYYYQDDGPRSAHVRAIRHDGLQVWQWPNPPSPEVPHLICGDFFGGVLLYVGDNFWNRVLVSVDASGRERWRVSLPGMRTTGVNITPEGVVFVVQNNRGVSRIVGVDGRTGAQVFSHALDTGEEVRRNVELRAADKVVCVPGKETSLPSSLFPTDIITVDATNFAYSYLSLVIDGGDCTAGAVLAPSDLRIHVVQRLVMVDIGYRMKTSETTIEESTRDGDAATTPVEATYPTGNLIPGSGSDGTGNILAVRKTRRYWPSTGIAVGELLYRVDGARKVKFRMDLPLAWNGRGWSTLLGEDNVGFTSGGKTVIAFNTITGAELWRWVSKQSRADVTMAAAGNTLLVHETDDYVLLKSGREEGRREEEFMLFVQKLRPQYEGE